MVKQWKRSLSGDDVQAEAEDALEKNISNLSPASNSIAANLDGGVAAVDWASKTAEQAWNTETSHASVTWLNLTGSGYLVQAYTDTAFRFEIDGGPIYSWFPTDGDSLPLFPIRFESSLKISSAGSVNDNRNVWVVMD